MHSVSTGGLRLARGQRGGGQRRHKECCSGPSQRDGGSASVGGLRQTQGQRNPGPTLCWVGTALRLAEPAPEDCGGRRASGKRQHRRITADTGPTEPGANALQGWRGPTAGGASSGVKCNARPVFALGIPGGGTKRATGHTISGRNGERMKIFDNFAGLLARDPCSKESPPSACSSFRTPL